MPGALKIGDVAHSARGFWGSHLVRESPETKLIAMTDMNQAMLNIAREKFSKATPCTSGEAIAENADVQAVVAETGDRFHAQPP